VKLKDVLLDNKGVKTVFTPINMLINNNISSIITTKSDREFIPSTLINELNEGSQP
jgi:hypothetical protein